MTGQTQTPGEPCPKCGKARSAAADSCVRCGLVFALWNPENAQPARQLDARAEELWREAEAAWSDEEKHAAFLRHCSPAGLLGPAGRRYRERIESHGSDEVARKMQQRVIGMATALLGNPAPPPPPSFVRSGTFFVILIVFGVAGMLGAVFFMRR